MRYLSVEEDFQILYR